VVAAVAVTRVQHRIVPLRLGGQVVQPPAAELSEFAQMRPKVVQERAVHVERQDAAQALVDVVEVRPPTGGSQGLRTPRGGLAASLCDVDVHGLPPLSWLPVSRPCLLAYDLTTEPTNDFFVVALALKSRLSRIPPDAISTSPAAARGPRLRGGGAPPLDHPGRGGTERHGRRGEPACSGARGAHGHSAFPARTAGTDTHLGGRGLCRIRARGPRPDRRGRRWRAPAPVQAPDDRRLRLLPVAVPAPDLA